MTRFEDVESGITLPGDYLGIVLMQPFPRLSAGDPFKWIDDKKDNQIRAIRRVLDIALDCPHTCEKSHFTVFPEYAIPGSEGVQAIEDVLATPEWPDGTVVVGGIDGLTKEEYSSLYLHPTTVQFEHNNPDKIPASQWVNCCMTWIKADGGGLKRWIQPKLSRAWPEMNIRYEQLFEGNLIHVFSGKFREPIGTPFHFFSLLCFDWIKPFATERGIKAILQDLEVHWGKTTIKPLDFVIVPQLNDDPNATIFLNMVDAFFDANSQPAINRKDATLIMANTAGGFSPGNQPTHGFTSAIFFARSPYMDKGGPPPTFAFKTTKLRDSRIIERCKEALFREKGECTHAARLHMPHRIGSGPESKSHPLDHAACFANDSTVTDPRLTGSPIPAITKWVNDQLDDLNSPLEVRTTHPARTQINASHRRIVTKLRTTSPKRLDRCVELLSVEPPDENIDEWAETEIECLKRMVDCLSVIEAAMPVQLNSETLQAKVIVGDAVFDIVVISGDEHEDCVERISSLVSNQQNFSLVISRDKLDTKLDERFGPITEPGKDEVAKGRTIHSPFRGTIPCSQRQIIIECCHQATSIADLKSKVLAVLSPP